MPTDEVFAVGISREQELENALADVLDLFDQDDLIFNPDLDEAEQAEVSGVLERASVVLAYEEGESFN